MGKAIIKAVQKIINYEFNYENVLLEALMQPGKYRASDYGNQRLAIEGDKAIDFVMSHDWCALNNGTSPGTYSCHPALPLYHMSSG